jgi:Flp pilus assembly protein TadD
MISNTLSSTADEVVRSTTEFQLDPPEEGPLAVVSRSTLTKGKESFDFSWSDVQVTPTGNRAQFILEDIRNRCERDARRFPNDANVLSNYGMALLNLGSVDEAVATFHRALAVSPKHFISLASLARIRTSQGRFDEAESLYEQLHASNPKNAFPLVNAAYIELRRNNVAKARELLLRAISVDGSAVLPRYVMALVLLSLRQPKDAISQLRAAVRINVRAFALHQALGVAYLMAEDPKGAERSFRMALALAPDKQNAVRALSNVLLQHRQFGPLSSLLGEYLEKSQDDAGARELLACALIEQKQFTAARRQLQAALKSLPEGGSDIRQQKSRILNNLGVCEDGEGKLDPAGKLFMESIESSPAHDILVRHNLVRVRMRQNQFGEAHEILETCRDSAPGNHDTEELEGTLLAIEKEFAEAIALLTPEIQSGAATEGSYALLSGLLADEERRPEEGLKIASEGLKRYPLSMLLTNNLAYTLLMSGQAQEARRVLESMPRNARSIRLDTPSALAATWGLLFLWEGDLEKGRDEYKRAEQLASGILPANLPAIVRQKMHLEIARAHVRQREFTKAKVEISRGLNVKKGRESYREDLDKLLIALETSLEARDSSENSETPE